jgi:O-antigen/teichoic acid export membrane protein
MQLASVPVFLAFWSLAEYGQWVFIAAIAAYSTLLDCGIGAVAMNRMTMACARNDISGANRAFQSACLAIALLSIFAISLIAAVVYGLESLVPINLRIPLLLLIAAMLVSLLNPVFDGLFRSTNQYSLGTYLLTAGRMLEWLGGMAGLALFRTPLGCAAGYLLMRVAFTFALARFCIRRVPAYKWNIDLASAREIISLLKDGRSFLMFPLSQLLLLQGSVVVVSTALGPAATAAYSAYRTICRSMTQLAGAVGHSLWPYFSQAYAVGDKVAVRKAVTTWHQRVQFASLACGLAIVIVLTPGLRIWTHGKVPVDWIAFVLVLSAAFIGSLSNMYYVLCVAVNRFNDLAKTYFFSAASGLVAAYLLSDQLPGILLALVMVEAVNYYAARQSARKLLES